MKPFYKYEKYSKWINQPQSKERSKNLSIFASRTFPIIQAYKKQRQAELKKLRQQARYQKNKDKIKLTASKELQRQRSLPIHKDLTAILEIALPDPTTGTLVITEYAYPNQPYKFAMIHGRTYYTHRLVMMEHTQNWIPEHLEVNHKNGIKTDNRLENLELVTHQENIIHSVETGLRVVMTEEQRKERIKEYRKKNEGYLKNWQANNPDKVKAYAKKTYEKSKLKKAA